MAVPMRPSPATPTFIYRPRFSALPIRLSGLGRGSSRDRCRRTLPSRFP
jgi:hypothetical protein